MRSAGFKKYFFNTSWMMTEQILRVILSLCVGIYIARYLGPEQYGLLNYAISFTGLFLFLGNLGLGPIVIRELISDPKNSESILGSAFVLKLLGSFLFLIVILIVLSLSLKGLDVQALMFIIALGTLFDSFDIVDIFFRANVLAKYSSIAKSCALLISSVLRLWLVFIESDLIWFAAMISLECLFRSIFYLYFYTNLYSSILKWRFSISKCYELLSDSWPLLLSIVGVTLYNRIDKIMINEMLGYKAVGLYSAGTRISMSFFIFSVVLCNSVFPAIINAKATDKVLYYFRLSSLYNLVVWVNIFIGICVFFSANFFVMILFGQAYDLAGSVLAIHIWAGIFIGLEQASNKWIIAENLQNYLLVRIILGAIFNVFLNYILIPLYGIKGAAFATLLSRFVFGYLFYAFSKRTFITFKMQTFSFLYPFIIIKDNFLKFKAI